ncbi:MAG: hypothetical protein U0992_23095 [Planctomycetaceae bacterium]
MDMRPDADLATFEMLKWGFAKDKHYAYLWGRASSPRDGASFEFWATAFAGIGTVFFVMRTVVDGR